MKDVTVYAVRAESMRGLDPVLLDTVLPERMAKARRFRFEKDRLLCMGAGYLMMKALGIRSEDVIQYGPCGKPFVPGYPAFNLSHSGSWVILACGTERTIGADIEEINEKHIDLAPEVYTERERKWMAEEPADRFFRLWTWKESVMKATGQGMSLAPRSFEVLPFAEGRPVKIQGRLWYARGGGLDGYKYSVCSDEPIGELKWIGIDPEQKEDPGC